MIEIEKNYIDKIENVENRIKKFNKHNFSFLADNIDEMTAIIQALSQKVMKDKGLTNKTRMHREIADYANEMDKEIICALRMFILITSPYPPDRMKSYQLLITLEDTEVIKFLNQKIAIEEDPLNRKFLTEEITPFLQKTA